MSDAPRTQRADTETVTPELALIDPELAEAQRQTTERKAAMSSPEPSNGTFFIDPAQPAPAVHEPSVVPTALPEPVPVPEPALAPSPVHAAAAVSDVEAAPMVDVPLGTLIFRAGLLAEEQLEDALQEGMRSGKRLGEVLLERGWLHERDLGRLLAGQKGLPFVEVSAAECEPAALRTIPEEKARLQVTLPIRYEDGQLVVAVADPTNELVLENLRRTVGVDPRLVVAAYTDLIRVIGEAYSALPGPEAEHSLVEPEPVAAEPSLAEPLPLPEPLPVAEPEPAAAPEPPALPTFELEPDPQPAADPEPPLVPSLHVEQEQPAVAPAVTPLPTVLPPPEERSAVFAEVPPLQPLVMEPVAQVVEPVPPAVPVPTVEEAPAPAPPAMAQPEAEPAPVPEPPLTPLLEPAEPSAPAPTPAPAATPVETVDAPQLDPEPAVEPAPEPAALPQLPAEPSVEHVALSSPAPDPVAPEPLAEPQPELQPEPAAVHAVVLRLQEGEVLDVGTFATAAEAATRAQEVVREIATAQGEASWPFFGERYLRPDTIVSVDLIETQADRWRGSSIRSQWAKQGE